MKLFIDSADPNEISTALDLGIVDGVTTNPSLATKAGIDFHDAVKKILDLVSGPVSLEVLSTSFKEMIEEARELAKLGDQVVVKLPTTLDGLKALKVLSAENIKTNMTLVFSPVQALLVAKLGATYVSPFMGRVDDISPGGGVLLVEQIIKIYSNYNFKTKVLAASVRNKEHVLDIALLGADVATVPFKILINLVNHKLTTLGLEKFISDWKSSGQKYVV